MLQVAEPAFPSLISRSSPGSATVTLWTNPSMDVGSGEIAALAIRRSAGAAATTTLTGTVVDIFDSPIGGAVVSVPGRWVLTEPDGTFVLPGVTPRTGRIRIAASLYGEYGHSEAVVPILGGTTPTGPIVLWFGGGG